jgi:UDP-N-acetylglucosamine--N-acetylmuramyl-(pentapeptide) pyrophosphoryl-undecaprenol N-acetylglucosamine transferase
MRVVLAGGGTGGHVIPALAIAQELNKTYGAEVLFVGTARGIESRLVPAAGYPLRLIDVGALKQVSLATRLSTLWRLPRAVVDAWHILAEFGAEVVIGVGGYASGPAMMAAYLRGTPSIVFEPNRAPGLANRLAAVMATAAVVQFAPACRYFQNCRVTGIPVRRAFFDAAEEKEEKTEARSAAAAAEASASATVRSGGPRPTLLVFGGSQGAHSINHAVIEALGALAAKFPGIHIIHQTGEPDYRQAAAAYLHAGISAEVYPFIEDMPAMFARADLLVCRSGASTVAEVAAARKPAIFIPFPFAADDHQTRNAEALVEAGAAVLVPDAELTAARLLEVVGELLGNRRRLEQMGEAAGRLAHADAAAQIAGLAARLAGYRAADAMAAAH